MDHTKENRIVMTLDAGGTNFEFSAIQGMKECVEPIAFPSESHDLDRSLGNIIRGFEMIKKQLDTAPVAISFAFPGPADYIHGIIGDLGNLPAFRGGIALGPMLEDHFGLPVFINNDGDLFAYGEAMHGFLPELNHRLEQSGSQRQYKNLIGLTLGTGFGGGIVRNGELFLGDNGAAGEVWLLRNSLNPDVFAEENISARAITREYLLAAGGGTAAGGSPAGADSPAGDGRTDEADSLAGDGYTAGADNPAGGVAVPTALDVYRIATGAFPGNREAALLAFQKLGQALGAALADVVTVIDAPVVIGGGLSNAWPLFFPEMLRQLNGHFVLADGTRVPRLEVRAYHMEDPASFTAFTRGEARRIQVPFSGRELTYDPAKSIVLGISRLGTSKAVALGAYAFALHSI
jgi:glucokinase